MAEVRYWVAEEGLDGYRVRGEVAITAPGLGLFAHRDAGDPEDNAGHFLDLTAVCGHTGKPLPVSRPGPREWRLEAPPGPVQFTYSVRLPPRPEDFSSYLRGWRGRGRAFFLGLALFLAVEDRDAAYHIRFRGPAFASCPEEFEVQRSKFKVGEPEPGLRPGGNCRKKAGVFVCSGHRQLFLSAFGQGPYHGATAGAGKHRLILIRDETAPPEWAGLLPRLEAMLSLLLDLFGQAPFRDLTFFLFAGKAREETAMGSGAALPGGVLLTFPDHSAPALDPRHLWLTLHEFLHQWLGMDLKAGEADLEWFFEGFTCFFTLALLQQAGWADGAYAQAVVDRNRAAYLAAARDLVGSPLGPPSRDAEFNYHFHGGFFLARRWDEELRQELPGGLAAWMKKFYRAYRGRTFDASSLLAAIEATSPAGRIPDYFPGFLNREKILPLGGCGTDS
jgi:hypothetical protein